MSKKRVSYQNMLKTAISEFDTSKTVDVKGPMLDPIISWDGDGELPVYKDAASILERYYFNEGQDKGVEVSEMDYNEDGTEKKSSSEKHAHGPGTEQAGTSDEAGIPGSKKDAEEDIAKESTDLTEQDEEEEEKDENEEEEVEESADLTEDMENAVIEKLIAEMEEEVAEQEENGDAEENGDEEEEEVEEAMSYEGDGVKPGSSAPKEKESKDPEEHTTGAGTEQAGTGDKEGQIPDRKDVHDKFVKAKQYTDELAKLFEQDEEEEKDEEEEGEEEKELDVDKEVKEQASGAGHVPPPSLQKKMKGEDQGEDDLDEAFEIFKEAIEDDDEENKEEENDED